MIESLGKLHNRAIDEIAITLYWRTLERFTFDEVKNAVIAHCNDPQEGKFFPLPSHLIGHMQRSDGRPSADEFWPHMPRSEAESVYWTIEAKAAFFIALPLIESGDEIAARMSFKAAYETQVRQAREAHRPVVWQFSQGSDPHGREKVLQDVVLRGLLSPEVAQKYLPQASFSSSTALEVAR